MNKEQEAEFQETIRKLTELADAVSPIILKVMADGIVAASEQRFSGTALYYADEIIELINSRPRTPTREEIAEILERLASY